MLSGNTKQKRGIRRRLNTTHCAACMQIFATMECALNHVAEKSIICAAFYIAVVPELNADEQTEADYRFTSEARERTRRGERRHHAATMARRLHGPLTSTALTLGIDFKTCYEATEC